jgi:hypothetical protein
MEEVPTMNQPSLEEASTLLSMTLTPGNLTSTTMTPMLHQATPDNLEEFDDGVENKDSEKAPTNGEENMENDSEKNTKEKRKSREEQQMKFMESTTLDDVVVDDEVNTKVGKKDSDTTHLVSIKGCCPKQLSMTCLRKFCTVHSISGYKSLPKTSLCNLIVEQIKTRGLDSGMYPDDFQKKQKKKKLTKNAKPPAVTRDGSYWRAISNYFLQSLRPGKIRQLHPHILG